MALGRVGVVMPTYDGHIRIKKRRRGQAKVERVMREYKQGSLHSSSGQKVTSRDQAIAIAMSEAGMSKKRKKKRY